MFRQSRIPYAELANRMVKSAEFLGYWFKNQGEIYWRRALQRGTKALGEAVQQGKSEEEAKKTSCDTIREYMADKGWIVDSIQLDIESLNGIQQP